MDTHFNFHWKFSFRHHFGVFKEQKLDRVIETEKLSKRKKNAKDKNGEKMHENKGKKNNINRTPYTLLSHNLMHAHNSRALKMKRGMERIIVSERNTFSRCQKNIYCTLPVHSLFERMCVCVRQNACEWYTTLASIGCMLNACLLSGFLLLIIGVVKTDVVKSKRLDLIYVPSSFVFVCACVCGELQNITSSHSVGWKIFCSDRSVGEKSEREK